MLVGHALGAIRRSGDGEPLTGRRILDRVTLLDIDERHLFCGKFRAHESSSDVAGSGCPTTVSLDDPRIVPPQGAGQSSNAQLGPSGVAAARSPAVIPPIRHQKCCLLTVN